MNKKQQTIFVIVLLSVLSYTIQRVFDAQTEPPMGAVIRQANIPYYWRTTMALAHGLVGGILYFSLFPTQLPKERQFYIATVIVFLGSTITMILVP